MSKDSQLIIPSSVQFWLPNESVNFPLSVFGVGPHCLHLDWDNPFIIAGEIPTRRQVFIGKTFTPDRRAQRHNLKVRLRRPIVRQTHLEGAIGTPSMAAEVQTEFKRTI